MPPCRALALFVGGPKTLTDSRGEWCSSIARERVDAPVQLEMRGFVGDQATQSYHGSPELAVCLHAQSHYDFWNATLGMRLQPGAVGENITLATWDDSTVCVGDVLRIGTARIQISGPRTPCENQARFIGRADWVKLTIQHLRTGMYARVLEPGMLQAGDPIILEARPHEGLTVFDLNACYYHTYNPELAERFLAAEELHAWWKQRLREKT
ncbi:MAG: MOSC domain-containing protein [Chloroflexaceae bacterium]|nr:MOSC domain-containing protein [Chloroflexaceae bacterium]